MLLKLATGLFISQIAIITANYSEDYEDAVKWPEDDNTLDLLFDQYTDEYDNFLTFRDNNCPGKSNQYCYTAWKHSNPTTIPIGITFRHKYCKVFHNSTVVGDKFGDRPNQDCRDHLWKHALRNYGCNCFSDNQDYTFLNWRARQFGVRAMHMGNNGDPVDFVDNACQKTWFRFQCLLEDLENGVYTNLKYGIYPQTNFLDPGPIHEMQLEQRYQICVQQNISLYPELEQYLIWGWQDQCAKLRRYECGINLEYDYHIDAAGFFHCGPEDNPDYINGTPIGDECNRDVCLIASQFADEVIDGLVKRGYGPESYDYENSVNGGIWKYLVDNRENYFTYRNHINVTNGQDKGCCHTDGAATNMYEQWPVEWDMNLDAAGNLPNYFPYDGPGGPDFIPTDAHTQQYEPLVHWHKSYSIAPQMCYHTPKILLKDPGQKMCCGAQPYRYPYQSGHKDCCDGIIRDLGACAN